MNNRAKALAEMYIGGAPHMKSHSCGRTCEEDIEWMISKGVDLNTATNSVTETNIYGAFAANIVNPVLAYEMVVALHCYGIQGIDWAHEGDLKPLEKARLAGNLQLVKFIESVTTTVDQTHLESNVTAANASALTERHEHIFNCDDAYAALAHAEPGTEHEKRLQKLIERSCKRPCSVLPSNVMNELEKLKENFPNFSDITEYVISCVSLELLSSNPTARFMTPVILLGNPGLGKTTYVTALSRVLSIPMKRIDCGIAQDTTALYSGYTASYKSPAPSKIASELLASEVANPIYLLDEIEKTPMGRNEGDAFGQLLPILERSTSQAIQDEFFNVRFDYSNVFFIATANNIDGMSEAVKSRFKIFTIQAPTKAQMAKISTNMYQQLRDEHSESWGQRFVEHLSTEVLDYVSEMTPRELRSILVEAFSNAARRAIRLETTSSDTLLSIEIDDIPALETTRKLERIGF